jgi:hypothetical protein
MRKTPARHIFGTVTAMAANQLDARWNAFAAGMGVYVQLMGPGAERLKAMLPDDAFQPANDLILSLAKLGSKMDHVLESLDDVNFKLATLLTEAPVTPADEPDKE